MSSLLETEMDVSYLHPELLRSLVVLARMDAQEWLEFMALKSKSGAIKINDNHFALDWDTSSRLFYINKSALGYYFLVMQSTQEKDAAYRSDASGLNQMLYHPIAWFALIPWKVKLLRHGGFDLVFSAIEHEYLKVDSLTITVRCWTPMLSLFLKKSAQTNKKLPIKTGVGFNQNTGLVALIGWNLVDYAREENNEPER